MTGVPLLQPLLLLRCPVQLRPALIVLLVCTSSACTVFPTARDVVVSGQVTDVRGDPVGGLAISYVVLKYRPGMPGTGEHGVVVTDALGRYRISIRRVYDVVSLSEQGSTYRCWMLTADIAGEVFRATPAVVRDFTCHSPPDHGPGTDPPTGGTLALHELQVHLASIDAVEMQ